MKKIILLTLVLSLSAGYVFSGQTISIKGSDTLVRLGQRWAEEYMKKNSGVVLQVSGGGSGTGIAALLNGTTDVCEASRDMKSKEYKLAKHKGLTPYRVSVALDGIAIFIHEKNPVKELSLAQLKGIYTGAILNWKEVGGDDHLIILYGRENNSGTYSFFKKRALQKEDYTSRTQTLPGTAAVVNAVAQDQYGIGYGGIAWGTGVKFAAVSENDTTKAIIPSVETVSNGSYPISRDLYWFFSEKPNGDVKKLLNWCLSEEGQKVSESIGYVPLSKEKAEAQIIK